MAFLPEDDPNAMNRALNFVTLGPSHILMKNESGPYRTFIEDLGVRVVALDADELVKAAGGFGCLTGVLERARAG